MKDNSKVLCSCKHEFQDQYYGKGIRVTTPVNKSKVNGEVKIVRCTVCGKEHQK